MRFANRKEAGKLLAAALAAYRGSDVVIYALPRGGVVLGAEVAKALQTPLDLVIARKIGHPFNPEYAICAVSEDGHEVCNEEELASIDPAWFRQVEAETRAEAKRRRERYLDGRERISAEGKIAILIDDGIATGLTMFAAIEEVKAMHPKQIIVAVPVIPLDTARKLEAQINKVVALEIPTLFLGAVGAYYNDFPQVSDEEVIALLQPPRDPLHLFPFPNYQVFADNLQQLPSAQIEQFASKRFANGELYIEIYAPVRQDPCIIIGSVAPPDEHLLTMLLLCATLAKEGAANVQVMLPYLAYMRQDKNAPGKSLAARWIGDLFRASGVGEIITIDIHSPSAMTDISLPLISLSPAALFAEEIRKNEWLDATLIAPDEGAIMRCNAVQQLTGNPNPIAYFHKERRGEEISVTLQGTVGERAIIIDDILDTGSTLVACCEALQRANKTAILVMVTHGLFTGTRWQRMWSLGVQRIYCTDTLPLPADIVPLPISVLSIQPLLAQFFLGRIKRAA